MRIPFSWIQSWTNTKINIKDLVKNLHNIGFEVDEVIEKNLNIPKSIVVGKIKSVEKHPNADKLKIANVDIGSTDPIKIVCGASNCREGIKVACALIETIIPLTMTKLKTIKLRGVESNGMLCSKKELCLPYNTNDTGIMELPNNFKVGYPLSNYIICKDSILLIQTPPNRPDCLSVRGFCREILTSIERKPLTDNWIIHNNKQNDLKLEVVPINGTVKEYYLAYIEGICISNPIHPDIEQKLSDSSLKIQSNLISLLNYITLELGQPLHAFDADKIVGKLYIRYALPGENIELLNGRVLTFSDNDTIIVADEKGPLCIAGIMGGTRAMITNETKKIYLECALFPHKLIASTVQKYNLFTQASNLYAKNAVDKNICKSSLFYTINKIKDYFGGNNFKTSFYSYKNGKDINLETKNSISLPISLMKEIIGIDINNNDIKKFISIIKTSGADVQEICNKKGEVIEIKCFPPDWRKDITLPEDIIEWYLRINGYNNIVSKPLFTKIWNKGIKDKPYEFIEWDLENKIKKYLVNAGFYEVKTFAFTTNKIQDALFPDKNNITVKIPVPISNTLNVLQHSLLNNLLLVTKYNQNRHDNTLKLFEIANVFEYSENIKEYQSLGILLSLGNNKNIYPAKNTPNIYEKIYFELKNILERVFYRLGVDVDKIIYKQGIQNGLWATSEQSAHFETINMHGSIGILNKNIGNTIGIKYPVVIAEIKFFKKIFHKIIKKNISIPSSFPTTKRSFTFNIKNMNYSNFISIANNSLNSFNDLLITIYFSNIYRESNDKQDKNTKVSITLEIQGLKENLSTFEIERFITEWLCIITKTSNISLDTN